MTEFKDFVVRENSKVYPNGIVGIVYAKPKNIIKMRKNSLGITAMLWIMCILEYLAIPLYIWCSNMTFEAAMAATMCWVAFPITLKLLFEK